MTENITKEEQERLDKELLDAVCDNDLPSVKSAIKAGADVNARIGQGGSILYTALNKDIKITECLLKAGADPNIQGCDGWTALHNAVFEKLLNKINFLLKHNADMYIKDDEGKTPFDISINENRYDIAELFISAGYVPSGEDMQKVKNHRLFEAVWNDDLSAVKATLAAGADVNAEGSKGDPLLLYTNITDVKIMRYLLENGINPNMRNTCGVSLLHKTSCGGTVDSIKILLESGADMTVKDKWDDSPFSIALYWENYDIAELFILNGYIPSYKDFNTINKAVRESLKTRFSILAAQVQEHKESLREEIKAMEFIYADEAIEM